MAPGSAGSTDPVLSEWWTGARCELPPTDRVEVRQKFRFFAPRC